jgi:hypothetical protein
LEKAGEGTPDFDDVMRSGTNYLTISTLTSHQIVIKSSSKFILMTIQI